MTVVRTDSLGWLENFAIAGISQGICGSIWATMLREAASGTGEDMRRNRFVPAILATVVAGLLVAVVSVAPGTGAATNSKRGELAPTFPSQTQCYAGDVSEFECLPSPIRGGVSGVASSADSESLYVTSATGDSITFFSRNRRTNALTPHGCWGAGENCGYGPGLNGAQSVQVTPDGKSVIVASEDGGALAVFNRSTADGNLNWLQCFSSPQVAPCANGVGLVGAHVVAISADDKTVAVAGLGGTLAIFARNTTSKGLVQKSCFSAAVAPGCTIARGIESPQAVAISADNKSIYVASGSDTVALFASMARGLEFAQPAGAAGCLGASDSGDCATGPNTLTGLVDIVVTPDKKFVYALSYGGEALTPLVRNTSSGQLSGTAAQMSGQPTSCVSGSGDGPCTRDDDLSNPLAMAIGKDGKSIHVVLAKYDGSGKLYGGMLTYRRDVRTGAVGGHSQCIYAEETPSTTCRVARAAGLEDPRSIVVTPDGKAVYTVSGPSTVAAFSRSTVAATVGDLTQIGHPAQVCYSGEDVLRDACAPFDLYGTVTTKDGEFVYSLAGGDVSLLKHDSTRTSGALTQGCISFSGTECNTSIGLGYGHSMVMSPDEKFLYVSAYQGTNVYKRDTKTGALSRVSCIGDGGAATHGCTPVGNLRAGGLEMAITKDGKTLIMMSSPYDGAAALQAFARNATTGALTRTSCVVNFATAGCLTIENLGYRDPFAVSPDGKSVYLSVLGRLQRFTRNTSTGALVISTCYSQDDPTCDDAKMVPGDRVIVSPDGKNVYTTIGGLYSSDDRGIQVFNRSTTSGALTQPAGSAACFQGAGGNGCTVTPSAKDPNEIAITPDSKSVYVLNDGENTYGGMSSLALFDRATSGALTPHAGAAGCIGGSNVTGCTSGFRLYDIQGFALSGDGKSVYVSGEFDYDGESESGLYLVEQFTRRTTG